MGRDGHRDDSLRAACHAPNPHGDARHGRRAGRPARARRASSPSRAGRCGRWRCRRTARACSRSTRRTTGSRSSTSGRPAWRIASRCRSASSRSRSRRAPTARSGWSTTSPTASASSTSARRRRASCARCSSATSRATSSSPARAATAPSSPPRTAARTARRRSAAAPRRASAAPTSGCSTPTNLGATLGGTPLDDRRRSSATRRARSPSAPTAARSTPPSSTPATRRRRVSEGARLRRRRAARAVQRRRRHHARAACRRPNANVEGVAAPEVGLIVKFDARPATGSDELGRNWNNAVALHAARQGRVRDRRDRRPAGRRPRSFARRRHDRSSTWSSTRRAGKVYVTNTEAQQRGALRGAGHLRRPARCAATCTRARITVLDGAGVAAAPPQQAHRLRRRAEPGRRQGRRASRTPIGMAVTQRRRDALRRGVRLEQGRRLRHRRSSRTTPSCPSAADHIAVSGGGPTRPRARRGARSRLYVLTRFDNAISVVDTATRDRDRARRAAQPRAGRASSTAGRFLYDARAHVEQRRGVVRELPHLRRLRQPRLGPRQPGRRRAEQPEPVPRRRPDRHPLPDFHPMKGPMTTQSLRGMANHGPMHWRGDRTGGNDAPAATRSAFDEDAAFKKFNVAFAGLLGRDEGQLTDAEMQAFTDFILQVTLAAEPDPQPRQLAHRRRRQAGRDVLLRTAPTLTDTGRPTATAATRSIRAQGFFGTDGADDASRARRRQFKIPHLRNLYQKVGMFGMPHGRRSSTPATTASRATRSAASASCTTAASTRVFRFLQRRGVHQLRPTTPRRARSAQSSSSCSPSTPTSRRSSASRSRSTSDERGASSAPRIDLLIARARRAGECDLVVKGTLGGEARGWLPRRRAARSRATAPASRRSPTPRCARWRRPPARSCTYTCVPPGSGVRIGIDRDDDGVLDATSSTPAPIPPTRTARRRSSARGRTVPARSLRLADATGPPANPRAGASPSSRPRPSSTCSRTRIIPPPPGSAGDPTVAGAVLSIYNAAGMTDDDVRIDLPASGWKVRAGSVPSYRYRSADHDAAVSSVIVKRDGYRCAAAARGSAYTPERAVAARDRRPTHARQRRAAGAPRPRRARRETTASTASAATGAPPAFCPAAALSEACHAQTRRTDRPSRVAGPDPRSDARRRGAERTGVPGEHVHHGGSDGAEGRGRRLGPLRRRLAERLVLRGTVPTAPVRRRREALRRRRNARRRGVRREHLHGGPGRSLPTWRQRPAAISWSRGKAATAAVEQDGSASGVFVQRFAGSGARLGQEFPANTVRERIPAAPPWSPSGRRATRWWCGRARSSASLRVATATLRRLRPALRRRRRPAGWRVPGEHVHAGIPGEPGRRSRPRRRLRGHLGEQRPARRIRSAPASSRGDSMPTASRAAVSSR